MTDERIDPACAVAHGMTTELAGDRLLVAVFASPVAAFLVRYATDAGFQTVLVEPDAERRGQAEKDGLIAAADVPALDGTADVVVTDHHRAELGQVLADSLKHPARWIGVMGNPRHPGPHVQALRELGVAQADIDRVHRPVGLNIGSRRPAEIAVATLAGLLADRNNRPGGFHF
ncbi:XdhC family protein [Fodinicola acaciae]|uniref:XdhC family protein n=1 Tax=Fodinicola acaciae TaxID=2681555 RepID=UPI0013D1E94F|nr:XdhC family protein [Fodinicola acaciae]